MPPVVASLADPLQWTAHSKPLPHPAEQGTFSLSFTLCLSAAPPHDSADLTTNYRSKCPTTSSMSNCPSLSTPSRYAPPIACTLCCTRIHVGTCSRHLRRKNFTAARTPTSPRSKVTASASSTMQRPTTTRSRPSTRMLSVCAKRPLTGWSNTTRPIETATTWR